MKDRRIELTVQELTAGAIVGAMRQVDSRDRKAVYGEEAGGPWQTNIEGALGEMALCKWLGVYWSGMLTFRAPDVGQFEVKTTKYHHGRLMLHPDYPDDSVYILVTGESGRYVIRGWILGRDGKREKYWDDPTRKKHHTRPVRPAFFVPQSQLNEPEDLIEFADRPFRLLPIPEGYPPPPFDTQGGFDA